MRRPDTVSPPQAMAVGPERLRWMAVAANELSDAVWQGDEDTLAARLEAVAHRHGRALGLSVADVGRAVHDARQVLAQMAPAIAQRLPDWYRQHISAPSFLLLPMMMKGAPFAMIYADQARPGALVVGDRELALPRTLRNQAVVAFRQASPSA